MLYTGGTTGRPKGVVWRHEDIFVALWWGQTGGPPIETPAGIGPGVVANPAGRVAVFVRPGLSRPAVVLAPRPAHPCERAMVGAGHAAQRGAPWSSTTSPTSTSRTVLELVARERVVALNLVGDAIARPLVELLEARPGAWDTSSLLLLGSGGSILSGDVKDRLLRGLPSVVALIDGIGSSESPAEAVAVHDRGRDPDCIAPASRPRPRRS